MPSHDMVDIAKITGDLRQFLLLPYVLFNTYSLDQLVESTANRNLHDLLTNNKYLIASSCVQLYFALKVLKVTKHFVSKFIDYLYVGCYDCIFGDLTFKLATPNLFKSIVDSLRPNTHVLDFGIGNGITYTNAGIVDTIRSKNLKMKGIDIDVPYVSACIKRMKKMGLDNQIFVEVQNIFDHLIAEEKDKYDYILLSESAPLIPAPVMSDMINHMRQHLLKKDGEIIFQNNLTENPSPFLVMLKPYLKYIVFADFGRILNRSVFYKYAEENDMNIEIRLLDKMDLYEILSYFGVSWLFYVLRVVGLGNYDIEQFSITLTNKDVDRITK